MSKLIIEVCKIDAIEDHPNGDRMKIAIIKGWRVCIKHDPATNKSEFEVGQKCVFFPPDSILPPAICNGPNDPIPGRLDNMKYLHELPKENGTRPVGGRVTATRLRGQVSYGVIMPVDPQFGDDPNWEIGTDVAEYFGIKKYEPPLETTEGDEERCNSRFYAYTSIEHAGNYPDAFSNTDEVVFCEKIHGCLHENSLITLYNGTEKKIVEIQVNDKIRSFDGKNYVEDIVKGIIVQKPAGIWYELLFDNGKKLVCTEDHLILTNRGWVCAKDLLEFDEIL